MRLKLEPGTKVQFTAEWLSKCPPETTKRFQGRVGTIAGYRQGASCPIVLFPKEGRRKEIKLYEVDVCRLIVVPD